MIPHLRASLIGLLMLVMSHAPIPWIHRHDGVTPDQLLIHLQQYHRNCPASSAPVGWHCHVVQLAALGNSEEDVSVADSRTARIQEWLDLLTQTCSIEARNCLSTSLLVPSTSVLDEATAALSEVGLFKLHKVFMI